MPMWSALNFTWTTAVGGHRGLSHSLLAAVVVATLVMVVGGRAGAPLPGRLWLLLLLATTSHGVLDTMTTDGLGVAFLSSFDTERHFFKLRPIAVSPIGVKNFVSEWAARVLRSEAK